MCHHLITLHLQQTIQRKTTDEDNAINRREMLTDLQDLRQIEDVPDLVERGRDKRAPAAIVEL